MTSKGIKGKTGRLPIVDPRVGKPFARKFKLTTRDDEGKSNEAPYGVLEERVGSGGFGIVYKIRFHIEHPWRTQMGLGPYGAVKILSNKENQELVKRFLREGKIGWALEPEMNEMRPNSLLRVVEAKETTPEDPTTKGDHYILMEYLDNPEVLSKYVLTNPSEGERLAETISLEESLDAIGAAVDALDYAHRRGITHRDIKPANLIRDRKDKRRIKLIDFGMGSIVGHEAELYPSEQDEVTVDELTKEDGAFRGTIHYASPETAIGKFKDYGKKIDVWGVGATAYALLAGVPPFTGSVNEMSERLALLNQIAMKINKKIDGRDTEVFLDNIDFLKTKNPEVPWAINDWVMRCLEKDHEIRMRSEDLKREYDKALEEIGYHRSVY